MKRDMPTPCASFWQYRVAFRFFPKLFDARTFADSVIKDKNRAADAINVIAPSRNTAHKAGAVKLDGWHVAGVDRLALRSTMSSSQPTSEKPAVFGSQNVFGALLMGLTMLCFVSNDAVMKLMFQSVSVEQGIFVRGLLAVPLIVIIAYLRKNLFVRLDRCDWLIVIVRSGAELAATVTFLTALAHMPLANVTAILQALPLTVTMFVAVFFGEPVGWRRWSAILIGFVGVLIVIRPGTDGFNDYAVLAVVCVGFVTIRDAITRRLNTRVPSLFVALLSAIPICLYGGVMTSVTGWSSMTPLMWLLFLVTAFAIIGGYLFSVMAMRNGEISFVAPFRYTGMIWAILFGVLLFDDWPDSMTLFGSFIVIGMGIYAFHRERVRKAKPVSVPPRV